MIEIVKRKKKLSLSKRLIASSKCFSFFVQPYWIEAEQRTLKVKTKIKEKERTICWKIFYNLFCCFFFKCSSLFCPLNRRANKSILSCVSNYSFFLFLEIKSRRSNRSAILKIDESESWRVIMEVIVSSNFILKEIYIIFYIYQLAVIIMKEEKSSELDSTQTVISDTIFTFFWSFGKRRKIKCDSTRTKI